MLKFIKKLLADIGKNVWKIALKPKHAVAVNKNKIIGHLEIP